MKFLSVKQIANFDFALILFFKIRTNFLETFYLCVFYSFFNKYACFLICENCFCFLLGFTGFKKVDFLEPQLTHIDFCLRILFSNATPFMFLLFFFFFHKLSSKCFLSFLRILVFLLI